ncbi:MAG: alpha/beta hydrolase [Candidatus Nanopelagicales bacterium]
MPTGLEPSDPPAQFVAGSLAYTDEGSGQPVLVAVPGLPGSGRDFRWLAPLLSDRFRVIRIDPPGYGASARSTWAPMTTRDRAESVSAVIEHLGVRRAVLMGHSAGGAVVAHLARHRPDLVRACVLISSTGPTANFARHPLRLLAQSLRVPPFRCAMTPGIRRLYRLQGFPNYLTDDERAYALLDAAAFDFSDHRANLAGMRAPTMVTWADDDPVISPETFRALAACVPPGPQLAFADGGHNVQKTHAVGIAEAIAGFVG